jgi:hypothetical protein
VQNHVESKRVNHAHFITSRETVVETRTTAWRRQIIDTENESSFGKRHHENGGAGCKSIRKRRRSLRQMKGGLALAHRRVQLCRENLATAVRRQLEVVDARHDTWQILVAADAAVITLSPDHSDGGFQPVQAAGWKGGIARQEAQEQAALRLAHILQHLKSRKTKREIKDEGAWAITSKSHTNGADSLPDEVLEQTLLITIK